MCSASRPSRTATGCAPRTSRTAGAWRRGRPARPRRHHRRDGPGEGTGRARSAGATGASRTERTDPSVKDGLMTDQTMATAQDRLAGLGRYEYGWADSDVAGAAAKRGLNEAVVRDISARKNEPAW